MSWSHRVAAQPMRTKTDYSNLSSRCMEVPIADICTTMVRLVVYPPCPSIRHCGSVKSRTATKQWTLTVKPSLSDFRKYCFQKKETAFIRSFHRPMAYLSAAWKSPQPPSQTFLKMCH